MRTVPTSPADVETDAILRDSFQGMINCLNLELRPFPVAGRVTFLREPQVPDVDQGRIVDLQDETGVDDGLIFFTDGLRHRPCIVLLGLIVLVWQDLQRRRRYCGNERLLGLLAAHGRRKKFNIAPNCLLPDVFDRSGADKAEYRRRAGASHAAVFRIEFGEFLALLASERISPSPYFGVFFSDLKAGQTVIDVRPPSCEIDRTVHRLAELAVIDDIDADLGLPLHNIANRRLKARQQ